MEESFRLLVAAMAPIHDSDALQHEAKSAICLTRGCFEVHPILITSACKLLGSDCSLRMMIRRSAGGSWGKRDLFGK